MYVHTQWEKNIPYNFTKPKTASPTKRYLIYMFTNKENETSIFVEYVEIYQKQDRVSIHVTHVEASTFLKLL